MKRKKMKEVSLAAVLTLALTTTALAAGGSSTDTDGKASSDTTVSIMQAKINPYNVSFTVPLYMTMAVMASDPNVKVPDNYYITNTTKAGDNVPADSTNIGVTDMTFEKLANSTYNTVTSDTIAGDSDIHLSIGGITMPALSAPGTSPVTLGGVLGTAATPTKIKTNIPLKLNIVGKVASSARDEAKAVAQFRVKYTVSLLSTQGAPLGLVYAGDDKTAAGLTEAVSGN